MSKQGIKKRSIDFPDELYDLIMEYAYLNKIFKFGPTVITLVKEALGEKDV